MPHLRTASLAELSVQDERSFRHIGVYHELKRALSASPARFVVAEPDSGCDRYEAALLLNLAFWRPGEICEVLPEPVITADQLAHSAWHLAAHSALGKDATSADGMLLAEAVASAFDVYLVGRLLGHAPTDSIEDVEFLASQVPRMRDAAAGAGLDDGAFEALLERMAREPEQSFEELRQLLFDTATGLVAAADLEAAAAVLGAARSRQLAPLLFHYELTDWVLFARAYATSPAPCEPVRAIDRALRAAADPIEWLEKQWLTYSR